MAEQEDAIAEADEALTEKERRWCDAYCGSAAGNGVQACRDAGYAGNDSTLARTAWALRRKPHIRAALEARLESDPLVMNRIQRLRMLSEIASGKATEERLGKDGIVVMTAALKDRIAAAEALAKAAGEHVTKVAVTDSAGNDLESLPLAELLRLRNG